MRVMKRCSRALLLALSLCLILMTAALADAEDFVFALNTSGDGYVVTGYTGSETSVTVPDWYNKLPVTEIGSGAFQGQTGIKSVSIPSTIVRIGSAAFKNCSSLSKLTYYTAASEPPSDIRIPGDANGDGTVNGQDALLILQYDAGWNVTINTANADVNGSGSVDMADALLIFRYDAGEDVTLK